MDFGPLVLVCDRLVIISSLLNLISPRYIITTKEIAIIY